MLSTNLVLSALLATLAAAHPAINSRGTILSFVNYQEPECKGSDTTHTPQTQGICHTIHGKSIDYYANAAGCVRKCESMAARNNVL